jgi:hypothetical protein
MPTAALRKPNTGEEEHAMTGTATTEVPVLKIVAATFGSEEAAKAAKAQLVADEDAVGNIAIVTAVSARSQRSCVIRGSTTASSKVSARISRQVRGRSSPSSRSPH